MACVVMVWFRADPAHNEECLRRLARLRERVAGGGRIEARAGWRDETGVAYRTWLETYEPLETAHCEAFIGTLRAAAAELGLEALALNGRHLEVFEWSA